MRVIFIIMVLKVEWKEQVTKEYLESDFCNPKFKPQQNWTLYCLGFTMAKSQRLNHKENDQH